MPYGLENDSTDDQLSAILHRLSQLETENSRLTQLVNSQAPSLPFFSSLRQPEPRVALPEKFTGERKVFRTFINQLELLFLLNPSCYSNDNIKIATAGSLCTGTAAAWFNPYLEHPEQHQELLQSWPSFKALFSSTFSAVDPAIAAANELTRLRQAGGPSINICGPFHDAQVGLGLERAGADTPIPCWLLEHRQDRQLGRQTGTHTATRFVHSPASPRTVAPHPTMMDVDAIRRQPLTPAEREHRFRNGLCLVCGTQGHLKATCPSRRQVASISGNVLGNPPINPDRTTATTTTSENYLSQ
ncbi:hypothetical protein BASA60_010806 [Batrachochytrium salamandrivorans]|nr:hypothetical protein BASA60_010806 [Batrachochytrium salamandrivorans]